MDLFRKEAVAATADPFGRPFGLRDPSSGVLVSAFAAFSAASLLFLALATYSRKETAQGVLSLEAGTPAAITQTSGVLDQIAVKNGDFVHKGQVIATVRREQIEASGESATLAVGSLRVRQRLAERRQLTAEREQLMMRRAELFRELLSLQTRSRLEAETLRLKTRKYELSQANLANLSSLAAQQLVSTADIAKSESAVLDLREAMIQSQKQIAMLLRERNAAQSEISLLEPKLASTDARIEAHDADADVQRRSLASDSHFSIVAPISGTLTGLVRKSGEAVATGEPLAVVVPAKSRMYVELLVPSRAIGFIKVGNPVKVMIDAFPYQKFGFALGTVERVALAPMPGQTTDGNGESYFPVRVEVERPYVTAYGRRWDLIPGMSAKADVVLEGRSFLEWIFDPVRATAERM